MVDHKENPRAQRARQTRRRMLDAARDLFIDPGYAETTMDEIAARAGVAVQTLYYTFRTKGGLLIAVAEYVAAGEVDPEPTMSRAWIQEALAARSADRVLELIVEHGTSIYAGVAPLAAAIHAATIDPAVAQWWAGTGSGRKAGMGRLMAHLGELGVLRVSVARATDLLFVLHGHETYRGLVVGAGWSDADYREWALATLRQQLLASSA